MLKKSSFCLFEMLFTCSVQEIQKPIQYLKSLIQETEYWNSGLKDSKSIDGNRIILLSGEMGAGKTTFIREFLNLIDSSIHANSPTFNLYNEYKSSHIHFYHFDLYRLKDSEELDFLGFEEIWGYQGISLVEWWKVAENYFPSNSFHVQIGFQDFSYRNYQISRLNEN